MIIPSDTEKSFDKIQHPIMKKKKKTSQKTRNKRKCPQHDKEHL